MLQCPIRLVSENELLRVFSRAAVGLGAGYIETKRLLVLALSLSFPVERKMLVLRENERA